MLPGCLSFGVRVHCVGDYIIDWHSLTKQNWISMLQGQMAIFVIGTDNLKISITINEFEHQTPRKGSLDYIVRRFILTSEHCGTIRRDDQMIMQTFIR
jgi:hypothetical protein